MSEINKILNGTSLAHTSNYTKNRTQDIKYIVIHYTANNGDTAKGNCSYFSGTNRSASAHYFVDETNIYRSVNDENTAWHCGATTYKHNSCRNNNSIGIEMCSKKDNNNNYFIENSTINNTLKLTKLLMLKYNITETNILRHYDVTGKSCPEPFVRNNTLWVDFKAKLTSNTTTNTQNTQQNQDTIIWNFFKNKGLNDFSVAGIMGNLYAESSLRSNNLQNTFELSLNMTDSVYTTAVDNNTYTNFTSDSAGYGLAQWTYHTRKQALLNYTKSKNTSISDLNSQLEFLWLELKEYPNIVSIFSTSTSVKQMSDIFLLEFEKPANQGDDVKAKRLEYSQVYYNNYSSNNTTSTNTNTVLPYVIQVTTNPLNIRDGAGTNFKINSTITNKGTYTITEESIGTGASKWGKLKSGAGWISLDHTKKV